MKKQDSQDTLAGLRVSFSWYDCGMIRLCFGYAWGLFRVCFGLVLGMSRVLAWSLLSLFWVGGVVQGVFWVVFGVFLGACEGMFMFR